MGVFRGTGVLTQKFPWIGKILNNEQNVANGNALTGEGLQTLPSFFVIGPPRTGSTWLHEILAPHAVLPSPTKETRFFDLRFHLGFDWYRAHYPAAKDGLPVGEVAPTYFASSAAREHIARSLPNAKVVCVFRNPVERVLSLYRLKRAYGLIPWNFEQAFFRDPELMESSRYATNLKAWHHALGSDQVMATIYDDLRDRPQAYLDSIVDFIGVPRFSLPESQTYVNSSEALTVPRNYYRTRGASMMAEWCKEQRLDAVVSAVKKTSLMRLFLGGGAPFAEMSKDIVQKLYGIFRPEVEELSQMLNRDLSSWNSHAAEAAVR